MQSFRLFILTFLSFLCLSAFAQDDGGDIEFSNIDELNEQLGVEGDISDDGDLEESEWFKTVFDGEDVTDSSLSEALDTLFNYEETEDGCADEYNESRNNLEKFIIGTSALGTVAELARRRGLIGAKNLNVLQSSSAISYLDDEGIDKLLKQIQNPNLKSLRNMTVRVDSHKVMSLSEFNHLKSSKWTALSRGHFRPLSEMRRTTEGGAIKLYASQSGKYINPSKSAELVNSQVQSSLLSSSGRPFTHQVAKDVVEDMVVLHNKKSMVYVLDPKKLGAGSKAVDLLKRDLQFLAKNKIPVKNIKLAKVNTLSPRARVAVGGLILINIAFTVDLINDAYRENVLEKRAESYFK